MGEDFVMSGYISRDVIWWRPFGGWGVMLKRTPLRFSERNGYVKYYRMPFGWRLVFLAA